MTKQKKFKRRVRARMEQTGERYTEAQAQLESEQGSGPRQWFADEFAGDLGRTQYELGVIRDRGTQAEALERLREFHDAHAGEGLAPWPFLAAVVLDTMWPGGPAWNPVALREVLERWLGGEDFELGQTIEPSRPLGPTHRGHEARREEAEEGAVPWDGDDVEFTTPEPEADTAGVELDDLWERSPDLSHVFFGGERPLDQNTAEDLARQFRRMADQAEAMGRTHGATQRFHFGGGPLSEEDVRAELGGVVRAVRPRLATDKIRVGAENFDELHGGDADELIRYAQEIGRLRFKLEMSGIDPDDEEHEQVVIVVDSDGTEEIEGRMVRRIRAEVRSAIWPGFESGFADPMTRRRFVCWRELPDGTAEPMHFPGKWRAEGVVRRHVEATDESEELTWLTLEHPTGRRHCIAHGAPGLDLLRLPLCLSPRHGTPPRAVEHHVVFPDKPGV